MRLEIPEDYFRDEEREGFLIPEKMKRCWATQMDLMLMIGDICERHGLRWWVDYGTLLGAVRHNGFIPWDDDIDISLLREDYTRLQSILAEELPSCCEVRAHAMFDDYEEPWMCVCNRRNIDAGISEEEALITRQFYGNPYRDGIDVVPLDYLPGDEQQKELFLNLYKAVYHAARWYQDHDRNGRLEELLKDIEELTGQTVPRGPDCKAALWKLAESIAMIYSRDESSGVASLGDMLFTTHEKERPLQLYERTTWLPFEMIKVPVPEGYEQILEAIYGKEWRVPKRGGSGHSYPFYKSQDRWIRESRLAAAISIVQKMDDDGRLDEEQKALREYMEQYPDRYEFCFMYARIVVRNNLSEAKDYLERSLSICDNEEHRGIIMQELDKVSRAIKKDEK